MQIVDVRSRPIDPEAPSFLTTFPAEIRNRIYELLFKREGPVLLCDMEAFRDIQQSIVMPYSDKETYCMLDLFAPDFDEPLELDPGFVHGFHYGLGLLATCKQLYKESVGVLYGNAFLLTKSMPCWIGYNQEEHLSYTERWVLSVGSQAKHLRKIVIDVDAMCPCGWAHGDLDILPLLRLKWKILAEECEIKFSSSGRERACDSSRHLGEYTHLESSVLDGVMKTIGSDDTLNLKRFMRFPGLVGNVSICRYNNTGKVHYYNYQHDYAFHGFTIPNDGRVLQFDQNPPPRLTSLPWKILDKILIHTMRVSEHVVVDLDHHTIYGIGIMPLHINRKMRSMI